MNASDRKPAGWAGRSRDALKWAAPSVLLAFIPKCPACFAAYVAAATGLGLSLPAAAQLRLGAIAVCVGSLAFLVCRALVRRRSPCRRNRQSVVSGL